MQILAVVSESIANFVIKWCGSAKAPTTEVVKDETPKTLVSDDDRLMSELGIGVQFSSSPRGKR